MENKDKPAYPVRGANNAPIDMNDGFPWDKMSIGLTKRELFDAMAMQGILSSQVDRSGHGLALETQPVINSAIEIADALLEQLNKG